jgi:two-component system OmpR family sensor kinase
VSKGRLTRQELGWLLTQEAQGAAERLRTGMATLSPAARVEPDASAVDETLSALDDTMKMLSSLHARPTGIRGRRGRIDIASLLWEVAPEARVSIQPGSGTEVFGDEAELRRMFHVMLGHGSGTGSTVAIRREADEVVVRVVLGPDSSATADTERAWLARMAIRYGGRYELEGSTELLGLPADGIESRDDLARLRKELDEARRQGETYARELAAAWGAAGEESPLSTPAASFHPPGGSGRYPALARLAGGVAATLRGVLFPVVRDLSELRAALSPRKSSPDLEVLARMSLDERLEEIRRKLLIVQDFVADLAAVGESHTAEAARGLDLASLVRAELKAIEPRALRAGVDVRLSLVPKETEEVPLSLAPGMISLLVRELLLHGVAASARGGTVFVTLIAPSVELGARILVDDSGTILPAPARDAVVSLEVEPGTFGRPSTIALYVATEIALAQGALVEIGNAPVIEGRGGGVRVSVTFPR